MGWMILWMAAAMAATSPEDTALRHIATDDAAQAPGVTWQVDRVVPWAGGTHVHLRQDLHGVPVDRIRRVVTLGVDGSLRRVTGPSAVSAAGLQPTATVTPELGIAAASRWLTQVVGAPDAWVPRHELVVWVGDGDRPAHLAWAIDLGVSNPLSTWRVWVDAHDGQVLAHGQTSFDARGNIYPSNPDASTLTEVELQGLVSTQGLIGEYAYAWSCDDFSGFNQCQSTSQHALPDANGDYLFQPDAIGFDDPLAEVQMYHHLDLVSRWFDDRFAFALSEPIEGLVNFEMDNAFYGDADGDGVAEVAFGQGSSIDFAYDADVIYHEFGHAVIGTVSTLGFFGADAYGIDFSPLSLNEGSADLFSVLITDDPVLGEYAGSGFGLAAIRDLDDDRRCPHDLYGEGHEDGIVWGAVGWNLAEDPAVGTETTAQLFYGAATSWTGAIDWAIAGDSLVTSADDLLAASVIDSATHTAIIATLDAAGLPGCERVIPLDEGNTSTQLFFASGLADQVGGYIPLASQYRLEAPEGTTSLELEIASFASSTPGIKWSVFVRRGEFIEHEILDLFGFQVPVPTTFDAVIDGEGASTIVLDANSTPPLEPGATYHFSIATRSEGLGAFDLGIGEAVVRGETIAASGTTAPTEPTSPTSGTEPGTDPDGLADGNDDIEAAGGCGCVAGAPVGLGPVVVLGLLGLARRR